MISEHGDVFSFATQRIMRPRDRSDGRRNIMLYSKGRSEVKSIAVLVCSAFHGPRPEGLQCAHEDGDPTNDHADNLSWKTPAANCADKWRHGTMVRGEKIVWTKLTDEAVLDIIANPKMNRKALAKRHGVSLSIVKDIRSGKTWKHLQPSDRA